MQLTNDEKLKIWQRSIETQMHFAELSIKMRQLGITLTGGTIALAVVLHRTDKAFSIDLPFVGLSLPVTTILCIGAALILYGAKILDAGMYHQMLRGAVKFNEIYERELDESVGWKSGLTEAISAYSRYSSPNRLETRDASGKIWEETGKVSFAGNKIAVFYWCAISTLIAAGLFLFAADSV